MSWDDLLEEHYDWPSVEAVKAYRDQVRAVVEDAIMNLPLKLPISWDDQFWAILMGIEHERIHLETSSVLIRELPLELLRPVAFWNTCPKRGTTAPKNELLQVNDQDEEAVVGKPYVHPTYGWDNEYGEVRSQVPPFKASKFLVTNEEFLAFVEDGGYSKRELWTDEGWRFANFRSAKKVTHPIFWVPVEPTGEQKDNNNNNQKKNGNDNDCKPNKAAWRFRNMLEEIDMPWDWPVEVNYLEAKAYCNWLAAKTGKSIRLPTEDEYQLLRSREIGPAESDYPYWNKAPGNINLEYFASSTPVNYFPASKNGFHDVIGNVWQHTETPIGALKGFRVHKWYDDFSVPTFDTQHNIIKGGSWISTGNEATPESRYAFRRHFYQHAGFRYVESARQVVLKRDEYERDEAVALYSEFHYGAESEERFGVPNFPRAMAQLAMQVAARQNVTVKRALDMGCAVGRATFELVKSGAQYALGLDFSTRFIRHAVSLREQGVVHYARTEEGGLSTDITRTLDDLKLDSAKDQCEFYQTDACNLDPRYDDFDLVLAANLLEHLYDPATFLRMIHERITPGGLLVLSSTYAWNETTTPKHLWLGGFRDKDGRAVKSIDTISAILSTHFTPLDAHSAEVPYVMRLTARTFERGTSHVTVWAKKN
eukprot:TRINITY_DN56143_c0_g1_i2.p1 TRINITY_DN56143_c0_g1~~TRINITY_DN56143_c0_g1_i2.p1  ORF type:complete len:651 (+),score=357.02 TRINITY_DN56143_c0_g1_i2:457-2409(+)